MISLRPPRVVALVCHLACAVFGAGVTTAEEAAKVTFVDQALPILRQRCGSCHNADKKTGGLDVTTFAGIMAGGGSGEVITPGDAKQSYLYRVVTHEDEPTMPPDGPPIPEAERKVLEAWINGGVLETTGSRPTIVKKVDLAMAAPADKRPEVVPMPAHLSLEPVVRTAALDACASIATSPWAPLAAVCGQKQILLFRTDSLEFVGMLPFPEGRPHVVRFSRGGGLVLAGGGVGAASGRVALWNLRNGRRVRTLGDDLDVVLAADVSSDQRRVVLGGPQKVARIYSVETGAKLHDLGRHTDWILAAAFSPDGALLATADRAGGVFVWETQTGRDFLTLPAHPAAVTSLEWRGDSNMLATGCDDGQIRLFEPENGTQVKAWTAHAGGVAALEFTRDGRILSIGRDKTARLWKADGTEERAFEAFGDVGLAASYCDETGRVFAGDWTGEIRGWNAADGARVGGLDANPPRLAERIAAAEKLLAERKAKLDAAEKAAADPPAPILDLKNQVAAAAETQARWLRESVFQTAFEQASQRLAGLEATLGRAEAEAAEAEAKRGADEQMRASSVAERDGMQKRLEALNAAVAAGDGKIKDLAGRIEKRGGELAATQAAIEQTLQALAVLVESGKNLEKALAAAAGDAELTKSYAAVVAGRDAKQAQVKQLQDTLAAQTAERAGWEQAVAAEKATAEKQRAEIAGLGEALQAVAGKIDSATKAVAAATKAAEEKRAAVAARRTEVEAATKALDGLQGIGG
jgi:hypothetical protein